MNKGLVDPNFIYEAVIEVNLVPDLILSCIIRIMLPDQVVAWKRSIWVPCNSHEFGPIERERVEVVLG